MHPSPLWPASLDHIRLDSPDPLALSKFYGDVIGMERRRLGDLLFLLAGPERRLLIGAGEKNAHPFSAWRLANEKQLAD